MSTTRQVTPTYLTAGDGDPMESQAYEFEAVLRGLGVSVTSRYWTGSGRNLGHEYQFVLDTEPAQLVLKDIVTFIKGRTA